LRHANSGSRVATHEALVLEHDLRIDAVAHLILDALDRIGAGIAAQAILAALAWDVHDHARAHTRFSETLGDEHFLAVGISLDMGQARAKFLVDALRQRLPGSLA